ncbi:MAG: 4'-phosphopantetheinyl transferase superfamily protein [Haliscomenobacter sp.]|nr:4'-phosphopantetheinyl transferase superfamily protein [Haliscomenobacter sp.]
MPFVDLGHLEPGARLGLWEIREQENWFLERVALSEEEAAQLAPIKGQRRVEFLAARKLVHLLSEARYRHPLVKDPSGKPHLPELSFSVSISHSRGYAAAILAEGAVGIDIQHIVEKIGRIAPRFLNPEEVSAIYPDTRLEALHVYWCAKEALFKAYGKGQVDFCRHLRVLPFTYGAAGGRFSGQILKDSTIRTFTLRYLRMNGHMLVWAMEKTPATPDLLLQ